MDVKTVAATIQIVAMAGVGVYFGVRGYYRRRAYWSMSSWLGFGLTLGVGLAVAGLSIFTSVAIDNHEPWVGAARSDTRSLVVVAMMAGLIAGILIVATTLAWFGRGWPRRPFPFAKRPPRRQKAEAPALPESGIDTAPHLPVAQARQAPTPK
jgi:hypothetical protein